MACPLCQYPYRCPCKSCDNKDTNVRKWITFEGEFENFEACPCCGTMLHLDEWQDISWAEAKEQYKLSNQSGGCLSGIVNEKDKLI